MSVFNEDTRVKIPATIQFLRIGYDYQSLREADIDFNTKIFVNRFKPALEKINGREFTYDEIKMIINDIHAVIKNNDLGREFYNWLINPLDKVKLIDLSKFIEKDFINFRLQNSDNTIGGMIVCRTNPQARKVHEWFEKNSKLKTGLVITDINDPMQSKINKNNQLDFRDTLSPDILIVNFMLTTGYDVKRLKKMYLLRGPHAQSLLQTISRVNRPYKSPTGKVYNYGYIVDFVDIEDEYNSTIESYIKELEADLNENGEDEGSLAGLVVDKEDINRK